MFMNSSSQITVAAVSECGRWSLRGTALVKCQSEMQFCARVVAALILGWGASLSTGCSAVPNRSILHERATVVWDAGTSVERVEPAATRANDLVANHVDVSDEIARVRLENELFSRTSGQSELGGHDLGLVNAIANAFETAPFETAQIASAHGWPQLSVQPKIQNTWRLLLNDQKEFYLSSNVRPAVLSLGASAILSNTTMDQEFADWYQHDVRSESLDDVSRVAKSFGEHWPMMGAYAAASLTGRLLDKDSRLAAWGDQSTRSMLVGVPPLLFLQKAIGSSRPNDVPPSSTWDFWNDDNGASGHTFVGAVPFLVAAQMTDDPRWKTTWTVLSTFTGWSRINDNDHYLSHVIVGWWLAYASTRSVDRSNFGPFEVRPLLQNGDLGLGVDWNY